MVKNWILSACLASVCWGLPTGNPSVAITAAFSDPEYQCSYDPCDCSFFECCPSIQYGIGYWGDYVFDRRLLIPQGTRIDGAAIEYGKGDKHQITNSTVYTHAAIVDFNLCSIAELFATIGTTRMIQKSRDLTLFAVPEIGTNVDIRFGNDLTVTTDNGLSVSAGGAMKLLRCGHFVCGISGQYLYAKPRIESLKYYYYENQGGFPAPLTKVIWTEYIQDYEKIYLSYKEYQGALGLSYFVTFPNQPFTFMAYLCAKWSKVNISYTHHEYLLAKEYFNYPARNWYFYDQKNARHVGCSTGCTITAGGSGRLTLEMRFFDELGIHGNFAIAF